MKNAEAVISSWREGVESLSIGGGGGLKNFRTGGLPILGEGVYFCWGV